MRDLRAQCAIRGSMRRVTFIFVSYSEISGRRFDIGKIAIPYEEAVKSAPASYNACIDRARTLTAKLTGKSH